MLQPGTLTSTSLGRVRVSSAVCAITSPPGSPLERHYTQVPRVLPPEHVRPLPNPPDRKSTRLNSSHTVIYTLSLHDALPIRRMRDNVTSRIASGETLYASAARASPRARAAPAQSA